MLRLGAVPRGDGTVEACVWAPGAGSVGVRSNDEVVELERDGDYWVGSFAGDDYLLVADGEAWPDPCSRRQPDGVRGPSRVLDTDAFEWADDDWSGVTLDDLVLYELHVGTFSEEGTFDGVVPRLRGLRELGVTAIELMPVATFPGDRGWGYDGLYTYAAHEAYGGPHGLARLVDAAHAEGLGVILDVVYNHVGPGNEALTAFGPYFTDRHETFWGDALDYAQRGVREWAIQNAEQWVRDFHVDGLRLDAVHAIYDDSPLHLCAELKQRVGGALVISEMAVDDWRPIDEWGHDAQWADRSHHELHVLLTGEREGYYADYGSVSYLAHVLDAFGTDLTGLRIALDCANGAYAGIAPRAFEQLGAEIIAIGDEPDGTNINVECGATDLRALSEVVRRGGFDLGIAFDGDGDRMLAVDERGEPIDGDQILAVLALDLGVDAVAVTTMTNLGFHRLMEEHGIRVVVTDVGDRYVLEALRREGLLLGGEQSGHIIWLDGHVTGDGLVAALYLCCSLSGRTLSQAAAVMPRFPQVIENLPRAGRGPLPDELMAAVESINEELDGDGRVLVRPSGTEPVVRVLAEAETPEAAEELCARVAALVIHELG